MTKRTYKIPVNRMLKTKIARNIFVCFDKGFFHKHYFLRKKYMKVIFVVLNVFDYNSVSEYK